MCRSARGHRTRSAHREHPRDGVPLRERDSQVYVTVSVTSVNGQVTIIFAVMPGPVPGIHDLSAAEAQDVDGRDKPGHDGGRCLLFVDELHRHGAGAEIVQIEMAAIGEFDKALGFVRQRE